MKGKILLVAGLVLVAVMVSLTGCSSGGAVSSASGQQEGIVVNGQGTVTVVPDIVNVNLGIQVQETSVAQAQTEATQAMDKVMAALKAKGVADKDIQTQQYSIQKVTRWDDTNQKEIVIGYLVTNMVNAKIRTVGNVGAIIDAVAVAGGDLVAVNNISFSVDKPENSYNDARKLAIADAEAKASQLATLSGVKLGKPIYITENTQNSYPVYATAVDKASSSTSISAGEMEISLNVQVVYDILD